MNISLKLQAAVVVRSSLLFFTNQIGNRGDMLAPCLRLMQKSGGKTEPKRPICCLPLKTLSPVCSWGLSCGTQEEERETATSCEATFPHNIVIRAETAAEERAENKRRRVREERPNGGKGWAQQPEAHCQGQRAAQNHLWKGSWSCCWLKS